MIQIPCNRARHAEHTLIQIEPIERQLECGIRLHPWFSLPPSHIGCTGKASASGAERVSMSA